MKTWCCILQRDLINQDLKCSLSASSCRERACFSNEVPDDDSDCLQGSPSPPRQGVRHDRRLR